MMFFKTWPYLKTGFAAAALAATSLAFSAPAQAHGRRGGGDDAAIAIGAGVLGLAVGAAIASDNNNNQVFIDQGYYPPYGAYANPAYPVHPGWGAYPVYPGWRGPVYGGPVYRGPVFRGYDPRWDRRWGRRGWRGNPRWGHRGGGWRGW
jgi:hypothetical protein